MKRIHILYWASTALSAFVAVSAGIMYFTSEGTAAFKQHGFPDWFRVELGLAKVLGALAILLPMVPLRVKEWAYAGFTITYISAAIAHSVDMGVEAAFAPLILLGILLVSLVTMHRRRSMAIATL